MTRPPSAAGAGLEERAAWVRTMPKAELHLHLDGSLRPETALELARTRGVAAPASVAQMRAALIAPAHGASQADLLRAFDLPVALMQDADALARVTRELVEAKAADGVRYVEIRWGPLLHLRRGLGLDDGIAAVCEGAEHGGSATGTTVRLICTALRSHEPAANIGLAEAAGRFLDRGMVGFDLAGPEAAFPDPLLHRRAFEAARAAGLRITVHAGEWGGPAQVRRALELGPERIAHGSVAIEDADLCDELIRRAIALDLCPTSNVQAGIVPSRRRHPLARLHRRGVPVTLSTDDLTVSDITLSQEYAAALDEIGLRPDELWAIDKRSLDVAFAAPKNLEPVRAAFAAWEAGPAGGLVVGDGVVVRGGD